ncbi:hypothetical protein SAMN05661044_01371 [Olivibacter domesticus]|uniref:Uncharacterized protein n=2 Tax=Olivibacter domesticus TaxID=407022 RepID=A0A1H7KJ24_OLID1|nr:hypothetical protein SAMN05661044_01371 [Olivibacter domesticus]
MTSGGVVVPDILKGEELTSSIESKNKTSESYKESYDQLWLLIVEDSSTMATYFDFDNFNANDRVFKSAFDKIFILRRVEGKLYELKTDN